MRALLLRRQRGVSLIEVLVALFLLAIGVLGAASLQVNAFKYNQSASERTQATFLAYEIADRMRANREAALVGNYDLAINAVAPEGDALPAQDLREWRLDLARRLPDGRGAVVRNGSLFTIRIDWSERRLPPEQGQAAEGDVRGEFVFVTEL